MSFTNSPNMLLPIPGVGNEAGPQYATDINNCLTIVDQHNHSNGSGVQITPSGLNINTVLTFNANFATGLAGLTLTAQSSLPAINTIYESGNDLYFVDGLGNNVRITQSGGVAGSPGSISNLTSPASASYVAGSQTFVWQSGTSIAANMDAAALIMRNISPNSTFALTLQPPAALSSNYSITLPSIPASQKIMTLDNAGAMAAPYTIDGSTLQINANVIGVKPSGITPTELANDSVTTPAILNSAVTRPKLAAVGQQVSGSSGTYTTVSTLPVTVTNCSVTLTTSGRPVMLMAMSGYFGGTSVNSTTNIFFGFTRNTTAISTAAIINATGGSSTGVTLSLPAGSLAFLDVVGAGTYTYTIFAQVNGAGSTAFATGIQLVAYEL